LRRFVLPLLLAATAWPAASQTFDLTGDLTAETDRRRRGLSESAGASASAGTASGSARLGIDPLPGLSLSAEASILGNSARHGGANLGFDIMALYRVAQGPLTVDLGIIGHLYEGASTNLDYAEVYAGATFSLGPAALGASTSYAPAQSAIGGDNLYLSMRGDIALPRTPLSLHGHVGRSSGRVDDLVRALRLRPGGTYWDWSLGADYIRGPILLGVTYSATSLSYPIPDSAFTNPRHSGSVVAARIGYRF